MLLGGITALAVASKFIGAFFGALGQGRSRATLIGWGMVPRGEVGLIFADIGLRSGILTEDVFGAVLLMVMATTFVAPPALKALLGTSRGTLG